VASESLQTGADERGIVALAHFLESRDVGFDVIEHRPTFTAASDARASGVPIHDAAKTILLHSEDGYRMTVIPAAERLDLPKVRGLLGNADVRLATEAEIAELFEEVFDVGALPPFGSTIAAPEIVDTRLLSHDRVLCSGGDHTHSVLVDPREMVRVAGARVADICQD